MSKSERSIRLSLMEETVWKVFHQLQNLENNDTNFGILILNQPILASPDLIKSLWEKAIIRATVDGGTNRWLDFIEKHQGYQLKLPDFISGDFDSIKSRSKSYFERKGVNFISMLDQDETDFTKALKCTLEFMKKEQLDIKQIFVLCENGGRFDQVAGNINTLHRSKSLAPDISVIILSAECITWILRPQKHLIYVTDEFVQKQFCCGLIPLFGPAVITTSGLKWNLDNNLCEMGGLVSTSNTYIAKEIHINCDRDIIWTTQYCSSVE